MKHTIVGYFDDSSDAVKAKTQLIAKGFTDTDVDVIGRTERSSSEKINHDDDSFIDKVKNFFANLGEDNQESHYYAEGIRRGGATLSVRAEESRVEEAAEIMNKCGAVNTDRKSQYFKETGFKQYDKNAKPFSRDEMLADRQKYSAWESSKFGNQDKVIPVIQENVDIGKKTINKGNVRVYTKVTERPVNEEIKLRDEHVNIQRTPVDRPVQASDMNAFKESEINLKETREEPVVKKEARVVEEVRVSKQAHERTERVQDTAKHTDVKVDRDNDLQNDTSAAGRKNTDWHEESLH